MSDKGFVTVVCEVALSNMFGYSTDLRSSTQVDQPFSLFELKYGVDHQHTLRAHFMVHFARPNIGNCLLQSPTSSSRVAQGKGEFTMEYSRHAPVPQSVRWVGGGHRRVAVE